MVYGSRIDAPRHPHVPEQPAARGADARAESVSRPGRILAAGLGRGSPGLATAFAESRHSVQIVERIPLAIREMERTRPDTVVVGPEEGAEAAVRLLGAARAMGVPAVLALIPRLEADLVDAAMEAGAHDVISPPHTARSILLRRRVLLHRESPLEATSLDALVELGPLTVDLARREVRGDEETLSLSGREFELLVRLMEARGQVVSRATLLEDIWGEEAGSETVLDATVHRLRRKLAGSTTTGPLIATIRGVGYSLRARPSTPRPRTRREAADRLAGAGPA